MAETPPVAPVRPVVETHFGITVRDPYRYMEDFQNAEVQAWVKAQAEHAEQMLARLPGRAALLQRIEELDAGAPYTITGVTRLPSGDLYYFKQLAEENLSKVYRRRAATGAEELLVDPEQFETSNPEDHFAISFFRVSPDEKFLLYGFAASGSEQTTLKVRDLATLRDLPETIDRLEAEYAPPYWLKESDAFVYSRRRSLPAGAPPTEGYQYTQAFLHKLGVAVAEDRMLFAAGVQGAPPLGPMDFPALIVPTASPWLIGQVKHGDETDLSLYVARYGRGLPEWTKICDRADLVTSYAVHGDDIFLLTAKDAPRFKVVRLSLANPAMNRAETVVPAGDRVVTSLAVAQDALYVGVLDPVAGKVLRVPFDSPATIAEVALPSDEPSASIVAARADLPGIFYSTRSWTRAGRLYRYEPAEQKSLDTGLLPRGKFDAPENLTATEVLVTSHDGVQVPLSIVHLRGLPLDGSHPALLSGYGAYGHTMPIQFNPIHLAWLERGGVLAYAHVRGGGAFGKAWHHAGRRSTKPNTWKDFIACGEYLVKQGYTSPGKLAGKGGSAGGILIGRAITERPDLFAAAQIAVGCCDMLRFETTMNGPPNVPEFGSIAREDEFRGLLAMSTLHHIRDGVKYPGILLTHGINDPRVEPWISAKATARFQAASAGGRPVLFRVDYHSGHGIGSTKRQRHEELADVWAFCLWQCGEREFLPAAR